MLELKGDTKVRIKDDLIVDCRYGKASVNFSDAMEKYKGKILTISTKGFSDDVYRMKEDRSFYWDVAMFDIVPEEEVATFFKKESFVEGMLVECKDGSVRMFASSATGGRGFINKNMNQLSYIGDFDEKLKCKYNSNHDIVKVYGKSGSISNFLSFILSGRELIWTRQEEKTVVSMDQIAQKFGVAVSELNVIK